MSRNLTTLSMAMVSAAVLMLGACSDKAASTGAPQAASAPASSAVAADLATQIIGKWKYETSMPLPDEADAKDQVITLQGVSEYFPSKSSQFKGSGTVKGAHLDEKGAKSQMDIKFELQMTSEWSVKDRLVYEKTIDTRLAVTGFMVNGQEVKDPAVLQEMEKEMSKSFMRGETSTSKTLNIDAARWTYEEDLGEGKVVTISATRL